MSVAVARVPMVPRAMTRWMVIRVHVLVDGMEHIVIKVHTSMRLSEHLSFSSIVHSSVPVW